MKIWAKLVCLIIGHRWKTYGHTNKTDSMWSFQVVTQCFRCGKYKWTK